jgi:L-lactate permease
VEALTGYQSEESMTPAILGQLIGIVLFAVVLSDRLYFLPRKIKDVEATAKAEKHVELEKLRRRLAICRRGYWIYVFLVVWIIDVVQLLMHFLSRIDVR